ncbi:MAG TPA: PAS domain S-box protein [Holophaga sp.]|nr:PAS domain S-box protein [Holophaga sp.]
MAWLTLDIRSLIVLLVFANLLAVLLMTCAADPRTFKGPDRSFVAGKLVLAFGWQLLALRGRIPDLVSASLGNPLIFFGFALEASAFLDITSDRGWSRVPYGLAALGTLAFWAAGHNPTRWVLLASLTAAAIYTMVGVELVRRRAGSRLRGIIGLLFSISALTLVLRAAEALAARSGFTLMSFSAIQSLTFLASFLLTISGMTGFILLAKEREERLLAESEARFSTLFHASPCAMLLTRLEDGRLLDVNEQFEVWTEYTRKEALGKVTLDLGIFGGDPAVRDVFVTQLRTQGQVREMEVVFRRKSGERRVGLVSSGTLVVNGEKLILASVNDITEHQLLAEERERMILELQGALADVRTLKGMLPICASCKRIRDDTGYWNQIEHYLQAHSEAEFTHGLCPDCAAAFRRDIPPKEQP